MYKTGYFTKLGDFPVQSLFSRDVCQKLPKKEREDSKKKRGEREREKQKRGHHYLTYRGTRIL